MANVKLSAIAGAGAIAGANTLIGVQSGTTDVQYTFTNAAAFFAAATNTLTNKTYDTAGTGNVLKINGTTVSAVTGTNNVVLSTAPSMIGQLGVVTPTPHLGSNGATILVNGNTASEVVFTHPVSIHVQGADGENDGFHVSAYGASTVGAFIARHALGTAASPSAETADTQLLKIAAWGYKATSYSNNAGGLGVFAAGTFTDTSTPTYVSLLTNASGVASTIVEVLRGQPGGGVSVGDATWNTTDRATGVLAIKTSAVIGAGPVLTATNVPTLDASTNAFTGTLLSISGGATLPTPAATTVLQIARGTTAGAALELDSFNANGFVIQRRAQTSSTSPGAITNGLQLGSNLFQGWNATSYVTGASIRANSTTTTWDGTHNGASLTFQTTADASATATDQFRMQGSGGLSVGNANIATDPGAGGVLATTVTVGAGAAITSSGAGGALGTNAFTSTAYLPLTGGTLSGNLTISGAGFITSGSLSAAAWTTNGVRTQMAAASYTDTSSSGTVATAYTDLFGAGTILASSATTYTNYYGAFFKAPVASTNVTMTNKYAIGADSANLTALSIGGNLMTFPAAAATIARTDVAQTFSGSNTFTNSTNFGGNISLTANGGVIQLRTNATLITSPASASLQHGAADVDTGPVAQTIRSQGALVGGTSDVAGANFTFLASPGKGNQGGGSFIFQTTPAGSTGTVVGTATTALTINSAQNVIAAKALTSSSASGGIGYSTGAGGTVTQATNKSTGVTLNTTTGQITMNNANLAGQTEVSFTLTNSAIAATDVVLVTIASGATANSYVVGVAATAAGSCVIQVGNVTLATTLGEAIGLNFVVIKGVTS